MIPKAPSIEPTTLCFTPPEPQSRVTNLEIRSRKHRTLIGQFSRHFIAGGSLPRAIGRAINEVQKLRHLGDYDAPGVAREDAERAVASAREFVAAIRQILQLKP